MSSVRVKFLFKGQPAGPKWHAASTKNLSRMAIAVTGAARDVAAAILEKGKADIAAGGNFGSRWTQGLHVDVSPKSGALINCTITVSHDVPYASVFETGKTIHGNPWLAIPLSFANVPKGVLARDYPGGLVSVFNRKEPGAAPLLISKDDGKPKYFLIEEVTLKKRFHLRDIIEREMRSFRSQYSKNLPKG
jgi:hypothetical protein